jgi:tetratricopeptide (TPR) repeat protein
MMDHPNIAKVFDAGTTHFGRPYFVMELVRGVKITDFCDEQNLPVRQRLELFIQVCQAVQHAHQKGIIHRDLKPSNIMVTVNDGVPVPKVIDFGIAKATTGQPLTDKTLFTAFQQFLGTPVYMSPEQAVMTSLDVDTRSDIYSLGVLLYELLTGKTPFDTRELLQAGLDEMRRTIREKEPARPSTRLGTMAGAELTTTARRRQTEAPRLVQMVRGDLDWIVMKRLEKDRARRYETANGLARDIERHLKDEPVVARPPNKLYEFQKTVVRHKFGFGAGAALVLVLTAGVLVSTWQAVRARKAQREQVRLRQVAETKERKSEQVALFLKDMLRSVERSVALGRDSKMMREILDQTAERVGRDLKDSPEVEVDLRGTLGDVYHLLGEYARAETMYRRALEVQESLSRDTQPVVGQLLNNLGVTLMGENRVAEAETLYQQALSLRRQLLGPRHLEVAETLHNLAALLRRQGNLPAADEAIAQALAIRRETLGREHRAIAESLQGLAVIRMRQGRLAEAEPILVDALDMQTRLLGSDHPLVADMTEDLGLLLANQGKHAEAERKLSEALALMRQLLGDAHPETITCIAMLLNTLLAEEKYAAAEPLARECLKAREAKMPDDPRTFNAASLLGGCLLGLGRYEEAEPLLLSSYAGLKQREDKIPWEGRYVIQETLKRIVRLYEATHQAGKRAEWQRLLDAYDSRQK